MSKISNVFQSFVSGWKRPTAGKYVSYKELAAYSVGGMGVNFVISMVGQIAMTANCILIGSVYGIKPTNLAVMSLVATFFTLIMQPLKSYLIDNTHSKKGKARPWLFWMGPPTAILVILVAFIPMTWTETAKMVSICIVFTILNFTQLFYVGMYQQLVQLMTPNTDERSSIISVSSIVYSMAPTVTGFLLPLISDPLGGLTNITVYRIAFPVFSLLGLGLGYFAYFGTKERIVVPKRYKAKIKFWDGMKKICANKYFWIINISGWFAFARAAAGAIMTWAYIYVLQNNAVMSIMSLILGTASLVGMLIAPPLIKLMGKRNTVIFTNIIVGLTSFLLIFTLNNFYLTAVVFYLYFGANAVQIITGPAMNADALDYQQFKTGDRLEGFAGNLSIIGSLIGMGTGFIIPFIYEFYGLIDNYDFLYDPNVRNPMFQAIAIFGVIGTVLHTIPYLFYDLSEKKHKKIIEELKERALQMNREDGIEETAEELEAELIGN